MTDTSPEALDRLIERLLRANMIICDGTPETDDHGYVDGNLGKEAADTIRALRAAPVAMQDKCSDCPPVGYPTDETRCVPCPRRQLTLVAAMREVLREHHNWHLAQDRDGGAWGIDPVDAYSESGLCERTVAALAALPLDVPAPAVDPVAEAYREGWRFAYRQCEATGSVPNPDHPAIAQETPHD